MSQGSFSAVSMGILLAGHVTVRAKNAIESADIVYCLAPSPFSEKWLTTLNKNCVSLQPHYEEGKHRMESYEGMVNEMLSSVRNGLKVCGAFYGHAGVFSWVPHQTVKVARAEGYYANMEPGISAEACLYSDLGIDPGDYGIQSYEASQFLFFDHPPNPASYLLLWQVALAGESTAKTFHSDADKIDILVNYLRKWYPENHEVILYEAAFLPIEEVRKEKVTLGELAKSELELHTTLVIPPAKKLCFNHEIMDLMGLDEESFLKRD